MSTLDINSIRNYLIEVGCKVEYPIVVNAFKKHLYNPDPNIQSLVRTQFKDYVNRLSTVTVENNMKFITLRPEFRPTNQPSGQPHNGHVGTEILQQKQKCQQQSPAPPLPPPMLTSSPKRSPPSEFFPKSIVLMPQQQAPVVSQHRDTMLRSTSRQSPPSFAPSPNDRLDSPQIAQTHYNGCNNSQASPIPPVQPRRQHQMTPRPPPVPKRHRTKPTKPVPVIEDLARPAQLCNPASRSINWTIEASSCNYNNLLLLLREDPKLAQCKDIMSGYTALHWAAKFGNLEIIRLMAGTYGVPVNIKSNAGRTPLHVAYMFNRLEAVKLLLQSYQANTNIRDHSGKKPMQYWQKPNATTWK